MISRKKTTGKILFLWNELCFQDNELIFLSITKYSSNVKVQDDHSNT
jgi:hypothetical protein